MAGPSDIPFVGRILDRIYDATIDAGIRGLRYLLCYNSIVNNLSSEIEKVKIQEERVSRKAVAESADGKKLEDHVTKWQKEVEETKTRAHELSRQRTSWNCFKVMKFPNPVMRFRLGRKAALEAKKVAELTISGEKLFTYEIAYLPADENIPISAQTYQKFGSRDEAYVKIWEALVKKDAHQIIGIYGMPGVGKTTMMEEAWRDAKEKKVFDKVARANVGNVNIDVINLQNQLAGFLGCHFESKDNEVRRASQLKSSLINAGKTLVVLDDVWDQIPLENIGIPLGDDISNGCKILLTSRKEAVCLRNGCKDPIKITTLTVPEAWDMFKNTVGTPKIDSLQDKSLAEKVCEECAALPLLIRAVGNALKFVSENLWKDALFQLENCNFEEIDEIDSRVYTCIQLSFDNLKKDAKTCLLLCSLFSEDADIEVKVLEDFARGSQLLDRGRNVRGLVDILKSSSLLLEGASGRTFKIHDIIRDVARSVAARDQRYAFLFLRGDSLLPDNYSTRKLLQFVERDNCWFPADMVCPDLHTLWLECNNKPHQFSNSFFEGIVNLKILVLKGMHIIAEQMSVPGFDNLTMLILDGCELKETWLDIVPENLRTLKISKCRLPNPLNLPKLRTLRKLEVLSDNEFVVVPNAISSLSPTLAELHTPGGFRISDGEGSMSEINKLIVLTSLSIRLEDSESCPAEHIVDNLLHFIIEVGDKDHYSLSSDPEMSSVSFINRFIEGGGQRLVERAEQVNLIDVKGSPNGFSNSNREAFSKLKRLYIRSCNDMEHLVAWIPPHYEIQQSQPLTSFSKLILLEIAGCSGLKYVFSASVVKCLVQLQVLRISDCPTLEVVIWNESSIDGVMIKFPKLKSLMLSGLKSLRRFYGGSRGGSSSSTTMENADISPTGSDPLFDEMVAFPVLEKLYIYSMKTSIIWGENCYRSNSFCQLKLLYLLLCPKLEFAFPLFMLSSFQNLKELVIKMCHSMTSEVESSSLNGSSNAVLPLSALRSIELFEMSALKQTGLNSRRRNLYPNLEILSVQYCSRLRNLFLPSTVKELLHLKELVVENCNMISELIGEEEEEERTNTLVFPELIKLQVENLPKFRFTKLVEAEATTREQLSYMPLKVSFPKLVELGLDVGNINGWEDIELGSNDSTSEIKSLIIRCDSYEEGELPSKWQLQLPNVEQLGLGSCWWHGSSGEHNDEQFLLNPYRTLSFQRLKVIAVDYYGLSALFSCSIFRNLPQLQKLEVRNCPFLEEVVRAENNVLGDKDETISLLQLESIELKHLPKLKSFSGSESHAFYMPALKSIILRNCPQMENFTCLETSTPSMPDFNSQIQQYLSDPYEGIGASSDSD